MISTDKKLESESQENENEKVENEKVESRKEENENEDEYENENDDHDETIKKLNNNLDEIIDKSKSFEDQIECLKELEDLKEYLPYKEYDDKELKSKYFKIQLADMSNEIGELFETIFGHTLIKLVDELINTKNKEENQIIVNDIDKNKDKLF